MDRYDAYKDTGIQWIGSVPKTWNVFPAGGVFSEVKEKNSDNLYNNALQFKYGEIVRKSAQSMKDPSVNEALSAYQIVHPDTIMINSLNLNYDFVTQRVGLVKETGVITSAYLGVIPDKKRISPRFATYLFKAYDAQQVFHGMGSGIRKTLKFQDFKHVFVVAPSLELQEEIADYLDNYCENINAAIQAAKDTVADYKVLRQSIISQAVTGRLDQNRPMKESGVRWLPEIPLDWTPISAKALFSERKERAREGDEQLTASQRRGIMFQKDYMETEGVRVVVVQKDFSILKHVEPDDFVISMRSFQGGIEYSTLRGCISSAYVMLIPNHELVDSRYYKWLLKSDKYINALQSTSDLIRDGQALRYRNFTKLRLFVVPIDEQKRIANYLDEKIPHIDALINEKEHLIRDLESYKNSVLFEITTGKWKVV